MQDFSISPLEMRRSAWRNRSLVAKLVRRDTLGRYQGPVWSLLNSAQCILRLQATQEYSGDSHTYSTRPILESGLVLIVYFLHTLPTDTVQVVFHAQKFL
jgi:ABC-type polysaccharide/polyol phosphate export permease